jgi:hypothetical protein
MQQKQKDRPKRSPVTMEDRVLTQAFETEGGKIALEYLEALFYNNSVFVQKDENTNLIMYKAGQQDVIGFIKETMKEVNSSSIIGGNGS